jgi:hypothetical protein
MTLASIAPTFEEYERSPAPQFENKAGNAHINLQYERSKIVDHTYLSCQALILVFLRFRDITVAVRAFPTALPEAPCFEKAGQDQAGVDQAGFNKSGQDQATAKPAAGHQSGLVTEEMYSSSLVSQPFAGGRFFSQLS